MPVDDAPWPPDTRERIARLTPRARDAWLRFVGALFADPPPYRALDRWVADRAEKGAASRPLTGRALAASIAVMQTRRSTRLGCVLGMMVLGIAPGCGGEPLGDTATWSVSGARSVSLMHDDALNYVDCARAPSGLLSMSSSELPGVQPTITVRIQAYSGPGTYDFTGGSGVSAEVWLSGGYGYWYFDDYSIIDSTRVFPACSITVSEPDPGARIHATVSCTNLVALITSPDYDDLNAAGFRPSVSLTAAFDCAI